MQAQQRRFRDGAMLLKISCPELVSTERDKVVQWLKQRKRYENAVADPDAAAQEPALQMVKSSYRSCIEVDLLQTICKYRFKPAEDPQTVSDDQLKAKLEEMAAFTEETQPDLVSLFRDLHMRASIRDPVARVDDLYRQYENLREDFSLDSLMEKDQNKKSLVKALINAVIPVETSKLVKTIVKQQKPELKADPVGLYDLLVEKMKSRSQHNPADFRQQRNQNQRRDQRGDRRPASQNIMAPPARRRGTYDHPRQRRLGDPGCLNCGDPRHRLNACPLPNADTPEKRRYIVQQARLRTPVENRRITRNEARQRQEWRQQGRQVGGQQGGGRQVGDQQGGGQNPPRQQQRPLQGGGPPNTGQPRRVGRVRGAQMPRLSVDGDFYVFKITPETMPALPYETQRLRRMYRNSVHLSFSLNQYEWMRVLTVFDTGSEYCCMDANTYRMLLGSSSFPSTWPRSTEFLPRCRGISSVQVPIYGIGTVFFRMPGADIVYAMEFKILDTTEEFVLFGQDCFAS